MKIKIIVISVVLIVVAALVYYFFSGDDKSTFITVNPTYGEFRSVVNNTGELRAKNSIDVRGPNNARALGIWQMKITKIVDEGTIVKEGDFVAELDKTEIMREVKEIQLNIQKFESQLTQAKLDSTLALSQARDELENIDFNLQEKKLQMEQSMYEAPSVIRQVELDYERTMRSFAQSKKNYETKVQQSITKINIILTDMMKEQQRLALYMETLDMFNIMAPAEGMVIYAREWDGRRKVVGSTIDAWYPIVATLPDLTSMESVTYVNEIDIQKIKAGQTVKISLDANPEKKISGIVEKVANIGEQKRGSNAKVFEVIISVNEKDTTLLPSMTTGNEILISTVADVLFIPLECLHVFDKDEKKTYYVFKKDGATIFRQEVEIGEMNDNEVIIMKGISQNDNIMLSSPEGNPDDYKLSRLKSEEK
ncbi:MAG: HlyD family efflux transporter periplasmic adaptor subunit [Candidatus Kapabacteria bacterium]|nr:HlyD family efflux transporter periplasmic adaptor subunit [Ignavibacteriota bacterium]MCW5883810.1 HlyD family efflux transporter periplasmic adaptor subunit [Candidatus Kapabacteria bacterium]